MKTGSGHVAIVFLAGTAFGLLAPEPGPAAKPKPPSESARIKALPEEDRQWLTEFVAPIILDEEKKAFLELQATYQREVFKREFWERRELPDLRLPLGPGYRFRYEELRRLADEKYDGWRQDAGRMVLRWGEPASILKPKCVGEDVFDVEVWTYNNLGQSGPYLKRPRQLWTLNDSASQVFYPNSCRRSFSDLTRDCPHSLPDLGPCVPCDDRCEVYKAYVEISARQGSFIGAAIEQAT
ncbi:MAG TPA: GWxTD domain-containing protein, partial [Thermoanaerobaculia bacterium]